MRVTATDVVAVSTRRNGEIRKVVTVGLR